MNYTQIFQTYFRNVAALFIVVLFASCGGSGGVGSDPIPTTYTISGATSGAVTQGVTLTLTGSATTTSAADGSYSFSGIVNGNYTVTPSLAGYTFSPTSTAVNVSGADVSSINFAATANAVPTYTLSGTVTGVVLQNVLITMSGAGGATTQTDIVGNYSFSGLANGSYTITPSLSGYTFSPVNNAVTISGANATASNFVSTVTPAVVATGTATFLIAPKALALSPRDGQLYVADGGYAICAPSCIRKVDPATGTIDPTPVHVGSGTIEGITFDATGDNLYYSDRQNRVGKLTWSGTAYVSPAACNDVNAAGLADPYHLVFDSTLGVLIAEGGGSQVAKLALPCVNTTVATAHASVTLSQPRGIALGAAGEIYVSNPGNDTISQVDRNTGAVTTYSAVGLSQPTGIQWLGGLSSYGSALVVALQGNSTVVSTNGTTTKSFASFPTPPIDVSVDSSYLNIYVLTSPTLTDVARIYKLTGF